MDKRYQVFVSSTYEDLREERNEVMHALLELDCIPSGMELFPAADEDQWTLIKKVIDDCDYYAVIIGGRYGSVHSSGKSYTRMEYEYALSKQKPTIAFLHENPRNIPAGKTEPTERGRQMLEEFRKLAQTKTVKYWTSPSDLGSKVSRSITQLIKSHPAPGWIRASEAGEIAAPEVLRLREQIDRLEVELAKTAGQTPEGSAELAQGDDEFNLNFRMDFADEKGDDVWENIYWTEGTWNSIFKAIAPHMLHRAPESAISTILERSFRSALEDIAAHDKQLRAGEWKRHPLTISRARLITKDLKTIIVQLRALGLIRRSSHKSAETYWTLTPLGDQVMTRLIAIKKVSHDLLKAKRGPRRPNRPR
jgi:DNA-binding HxlR family transcriptional regulator